MASLKSTKKPVHLTNDVIVISDDDLSPRIIKPRIVKRSKIKLYSDRRDSDCSSSNNSPKCSKRKQGNRDSESDSDYKPAEDVDSKPRVKKFKSDNDDKVTKKSAKNPTVKKEASLKSRDKNAQKDCSPSKSLKTKLKSTSKKVLKPKTIGVKKKPATKTTPKPRKKAAVNLDISTCSSTSSGWDIVEEIAALTQTPLDISMNVVNLLNNENTIPFIARYRKEMTGNMEAPKLRQLEDIYETLKTVKVKTQTVIQNVEKMGKLTDNLLKALETTKSLDELEHLYAPFKLGRKSLAEKARSRGLETPAMSLLQNSKIPVNLHEYINSSDKDLDTVGKVGLGIQHILSEIISKDYDVIKEVQKLFPTSVMTVRCKMNRNFAKKADEGDTSKYKFELYYDFRNRASRLRSHQVLAINRGENLKILSVKVYPDNFPVTMIKTFIYQQFFLSRQNINCANEPLVTDCIEYCYSKSIEPLVERRVRSELTKTAEKESVEVFATNLSNLLLTPPLHGKVVIAVDPGYTHGSKLAVVGETGEILHVETLMLLDRKCGKWEVDKFVQIAQAFRCQVIAIGNGTGCRDVESVVSNLIAKRAFDPIEVSYCIINESGVSIYSCSDLAAVELPEMEANLRSAVSLARRLIDPLSEYIKVEPKHLGVGMYQHDISENVLKKTLDNVVEECICFTGIDINTCSQIALSKIAGLKGKKPEAIIKWRKENGGFINREQIKKVPGIGPVTYEQCAGFLRISPITLETCKKQHYEELSFSSKPKKLKTSTDYEGAVNMLDRTIIHPESYGAAHKIIKLAGCKVEDVGSFHFISTMEKFLSPSKVDVLAKELDIGVPTISLISDGFRKSLDYDIREEFNKPLFKQQFTAMNSLAIGMVLSGKVMNVTTFGAFVDVGVDRDGLIHNSKMDKRILGGRQLGVGDCIEAKVITIDLQRNKFSLSLHAVLDRPKVVLR